MNNFCCGQSHVNILSARQCAPIDGGLDIAGEAVGAAEGGSQQAAVAAGVSVWAGVFLTVLSRNGVICSVCAGNGRAGPARGPASDARDAHIRGAIQLCWGVAYVATSADSGRGRRVTSLMCALTTKIVIKFL